MSGPVSTDTSNLVLWVITALASVCALLFGRGERIQMKAAAATEAEKGEIKASLKTSIENWEKERTKYQETIKMLGDKLDALREKQAENSTKMATMLLMARRDIGTPEPWEDDMPTGVHKLVAVVPTNERKQRLDQELREFVNTTPPEAYPRTRSPKKDR